MLIPDVNILLYAYDTQSPYQDKAFKWLSDAFKNNEVLIGISPIVAVGFIRLSINLKLYKKPLTISQAQMIVNSWFTNGAVTLHHGKNHYDILFSLLKESHGSSSLTTDAHLAALAIEHNGSVCTNDKDFLRFKDLKVINPVE